jgi:hypothetical protein
MSGKRSFGDLPTPRRAAIGAARAAHIGFTYGRRR